MGNTPPLPQRPPDVIHVIGVPRPPSFFTPLPLSCILLNTNRRAKKWGRPGNETKKLTNQNTITTQSEHINHAKRVTNQTHMNRSKDSYTCWVSMKLCFESKLASTGEQVAYMFSAINSIATGLAFVQVTICFVWWVVSAMTIHR